MTIKKNKKDNKRNNKKKNPLYAVSDDGKVVEPASGFLDFIIKTLGIEPLFDMVNELFAIFASQINTYIGVHWLGELLKEWIKLLKDGLSHFNKLFSAGLARN